MHPVKVILARHGETDWNASARIQGKSDIPLNGRGRAQARELAAAVQRLGTVEIIYASPLSRALETAQIIGRALGLEPAPAAALTELNFGDWEGCSWEEIGRRWPEQFAAYSADRKNYAPPNGESYAEMLRRARPFVDALRARPSAGAALCVCHSAVMRGLLAEEAGLEVGESYKKLKLPNGALAALESRV